MFIVMFNAQENDEPVSTSVDWETEEEAIAEAEDLVEDCDCWEAWVEEV